MDPAPDINEDAVLQPFRDENTRDADIWQDVDAAFLEQKKATIRADYAKRRMALSDDELQAIISKRPTVHFPTSVSLVFGPLTLSENQAAAKERIEFQERQDAERQLWELVEEALSSIHHDLVQNTIDAEFQKAKQKAIEERKRERKRQQSRATAAAGQDHRVPGSQVGEKRRHGGAGDDSASSASAAASSSGEDDDDHIDFHVTGEEMLLAITEVLQPVDSELSSHLRDSGHQRAFGQYGSISLQLAKAQDGLSFYRTNWPLAGRAPDAKSFHLLKFVVLDGFDNASVEWPHGVAGSMAAVVRTTISKSISWYISGSALSDKNKEAFGAGVNQLLNWFERVQPLMERFSRGEIVYNGSDAANNLAMILQRFQFVGIADPKKPTEQHFWVHPERVSVRIGFKGGRRWEVTVGLLKEPAFFKGTTRVNKALFDPVSGFEEVKLAWHAVAGLQAVTARSIPEHAALQHTKHMAQTGITQHDLQNSAHHIISPAHIDMQDAIAGGRRRVRLHNAAQLSSTGKYYFPPAPYSGAQ